MQKLQSKKTKTNKKRAQIRRVGESLMLWGENIIKEGGSTQKKEAKNIQLLVVFVEERFQDTRLFL